MYNKYCSLCRRLSLEGSKATWSTTLLTITQNVVGREHSGLTSAQTYSANYRCRKGAERPDLQYCLLCCRPLLEGSRVTWFTTVQTTSVGREQSNLTYNIAHCIADHCWKGAKRPDQQHYLLSHRLLWEGSVADWLQYNLNNTELVEGSGWARGPDENLVTVYVDSLVKVTAFFVGLHKV